MVQFMDIHPGECWLNDLLQGSYMALSDVHDVDVVAAARAVLGVEVAPVHKQLNKNNHNPRANNASLLPCLSFQLRLVRHKASGCWVSPGDPPRSCPRGERPQG